MKVEKSKISELIKESQRITICAGPCVSRTREYPRGLQRRNGKTISPKLRNTFQEFEEYSEMIRFAIERGGFFLFCSWPNAGNHNKGHARGNETNWEANPVIQARNYTTLN